MKRALAFGFYVLLACVIVMPVQAQPEPPSGPIKMELTDKPVMYDHAIHISQDCGACHTTMPTHFPPLSVDNVQRCVVCHHLVDGEIPPTNKCSDCHYETDIRDKTEYSYFRITHARNLPEGRVSCLSCHMEVAQNRPEKRQALTSCVGSSCHPR